MASLQRWDPSTLAAKLHLSTEAAVRVHNACRGKDDVPVGGASPPKSLVVTSWTTHTHLKDIAVKQHLGRGGEAVVIGDGWLFEVQSSVGKSNHTRCRLVQPIRCISCTSCCFAACSAMGSNQLHPVWLSFFVSLRSPAAAVCSFPSPTVIFLSGF